MSSSNSILNPDFYETIERKEEKLPYITVLKNDDLIKFTPREFSKFLGCIIKIVCTPNPYDGLRRSITCIPDIQQEFLPETDRFYLIYRQHHNLIYLRKLNETNETAPRRYWSLRLNTAGITIYEKEPNYYDITKVFIYNHITSEMFSDLNEKQREKIEQQKKALVKSDTDRDFKLSKYILQKDIFDIVITYLPIPIHYAIDQLYYIYSWILRVEPCSHTDSIE